jgi:hypothetical protein
MFLKKSLIGLVGLLVLVGGLAAVMPLVSRGQGNNPLVKQLQPRQFYLTQTQHNGSQALTACASGYHMASLWEIFDTSNLRYNTALGASSNDSGSGPPAVDIVAGHIFSGGWIRTGGGSVSGGFPGEANCSNWTLDTAVTEGTVVGLTRLWSSTSSANQISPWRAFVQSCQEPQQVWCVQD